MAQSPAPGKAILSAVATCISLIYIQASSGDRVFQLCKHGVNLDSAQFPLITWIIILWISFEVSCHSAIFTNDTPKSNHSMDLFTVI